MRIASVEAAKSAIFRELNVPGFRIAGLAAHFDVKMQGLTRLMASEMVFTMLDIGRASIGRSFNDARDIALSKGRKLIDLLNNCHPDDRETMLQIMDLAAKCSDHETSYHQMRVMHLCTFIADNVGLAPKERSDLILAARMHDFGKIGLPIQIMGDTGRFGKEGKEIKKLHLLLALWLFEQVPWLKDMYEILRYNHILDGYPEGLSPKDMSPASQILSAADFYDALTSKRSYRNPIDKETAIIETAKRPYADAVVKALVKTIRPGNYILENLRRMFSHRQIKSRGIALNHMAIQNFIPVAQAGLNELEFQIVSNMHMIWELGQHSFCHPFAMQIASGCVRAIDGNLGESWTSFARSGLLTKDKIAKLYIIMERAEKIDPQTVPVIARYVLAAADQNCPERIGEFISQLWYDERPDYLMFLGRVLLDGDQTIKDTHPVFGSNAFIDRINALCLSDQETIKP